MVPVDSFRWTFGAFEGGLLTSGAAFLKQKTDGVLFYESTRLHTKPRDQALKKRRGVKFSD